MMTLESAQISGAVIDTSQAEHGFSSEKLVFPMSFAQERLWFLDQLDPGTSIHNIAEGFRLAGLLDWDALRDAINEIVRRHEALRTTFAAVDDNPAQVVAPTLAIDLPIIDLRALPSGERDKQALSRANLEARRPFDLMSGPLLRATLIRLDDEDHLLVVTMHHIASEGGWSMGVFVRELGLLYASFAAGRPPSLPELPVQYPDYAVWQRDWLRGDALDRQIAYWTSQLAGAPSMLELPTDRPRPPQQSFDGARFPHHLPRALLDEVRALGRGEGATLFMTLLAAFQALLFRYTGQDDIVVGVPVAGRSRPEVEGLIGLFVNTLALRARVSENLSFRRLLVHVRETALHAFAHQDVPFEKVVEAVRPERALNRNPLFQVMFALQNTARPELSLPKIAATPVELDTGSSQFDLTLHAWERDDGLRVVLEYGTALFDAESIERMLQHFHTLLQAAVRHPDEPISTLPLLTEAECEHLLVSVNDTRAFYPAGVCLHQLVEARARVTPGAVAVTCGSEVLTYGELDRRANRIAHFLGSLGVGPESLVGILLERSSDMLVGLLGILKAGGAYLPLDPAFPAERITDMLADSKAPVLLTERHLADRVSPYAGVVACIDAERATIAAQPATSPPAVASPSGLAYVIYTSGSTGQPKGVQITHRNVVNLLTDMCGRVQMKPSDVLVAVTTLSFDIAGLELWLPLIAGARVVIASRDEATDAVRLAHELQRVGATVMQATPVTWQMLLESGWRGSDRLTALCGGEALSWELANRLLPKVRRLWNVYGPTETTIWSTAFLVTSRNEDCDGGIVPIGLPIANTSIYILDARRQLVPMGAPGELYIGGAGVGSGYLHRPELTAERFIANPFALRSEERLYRTGDRVRLRAKEAAVEFLGRLDDQVKLRGFRIELGEIEAAIATHPAVQEAAAAVREPTRGDRRLIAYVVPRPAVEMPAPDSLRAMLATRLPAYMLPSAVVELDALPRTANGKVDRRRLPTPTAPVPAECGGVAEMPRNDVERTLQAIWEGVLGVSPIGIGDNFFDLGGHSLLAVRVFSEIRARLGRSLPLVTLFRAPTIERLAEAIARSEPAAAWSPLVPIGQPTGAGEAPLFIIHGLTGEIMNLHALALRLAAARPVYAIRARGLDGGPPPLDRIEDMADYYLDHIRRVQPHGPYRFLGFCFGGLVAFEMARRLSSAGETVAFLGLLDSAFHQRFLVPLGRLRFELAKRRIHAETLQRLPLGKRVAYLRGKLGARLARWMPAAERSEEMPYLAYLPNAADVPAELRAVTFAAARAFCHYEPGFYTGQVTYVRPELHDFRNILNFAPEWRRKAAGGVEILSVPGDHMTMLEAPAVDTLAVHLRARLQTVVP